jgi:hypothetical protein
MKQSLKLYTTLGLLLVIIGIIIQGWISIFQLATDSITYTNIVWYDIGIILVITGSVLFTDMNINRLFAIYHRIDYAVSMTGLVGLGILLLSFGYLESLLFPRTMVVYFLILDFFWIFFLGLLLTRFKIKANTKSTTS